MFAPLFTLTLQSFVILSSANLEPESTTVRVPSLRTIFAEHAVEDVQARRLHLSLAPTGNEVRYRVREQLVGVTLPNDAVGKTDRVSGMIVVEPDGRVVKEESKFVVTLDSIRSDQSRRDNFIRMRTLQTAQFPTAEFVPSSATGLPATLPLAGDLTFKLTGDFTVHGVTRPTTWDVKGRMLANGEFSGSATTWFRFGDFNMNVPRVAVVVSVVDSINVEMDLHLVPSADR
jgi:polyisoprenoid-binding protein YceI